MKQNNYTAKDIERYHSGELSSAEMHALEKAALDDLFLADALEGYQHTQTAAADLTSLQQKLQTRIQKDEDKRKVFFIGGNWMKIAALFILFAGGGWLVFHMFSNKKQELATNQTVQKQKIPVEISSTKDSNNTHSDAPNTNTTTFNQSEPVIEKNVTESRQNPPSKNERDIVIVETQQQQNQGLTSPPVTTQSSVDSLQTIATKRFETSAFKKDANADSLLARSNGFKESRAKDAEDLMSRRAPSSTDRKLSGRVSGVKVDTIKNFDVVLQQSEMAEDEVVVVNKNKTVARHDAKRRMQVTVDTLEPAEGWTNFGDYIATNMRAPEELETKPLKGEVELSFEVNKQGEPVNITITRSLCDKCDEEAIRLLKEGPRWKKNKKKGKVRFSF